MSLTYEEALAVLDSAIVFGTNPSLEPIAAIARELGDPQNSFAPVQITGTNGKTSTSRMTAAILRAHGMRAGLYTSPELERYNERIEIDGEPVSDEEFAAAIDAAVTAAGRALPAEEPATEFELLTAAALWTFRERSVDVAVLEVGLGGRWDATSVASASVAVITGVGLDHVGILGETREAIAAEKAAIIRPATSPILGPGTIGVESVFLERATAASTHARAVRADGQPSPVDEDLTIRFALRSTPQAPGGRTVADVVGIHGEYRDLRIPGPSYQAPNIATAVAASEAALGRALDLEETRAALAGLRIPGRFELVSARPPVVIDAAHNPQAAAVLADAISEAFGDARPALLLGILGDKDAEGIAAALAPVVGEIAVTRSHSDRALPSDQLAAMVEAATGRAPAVFVSVAEALARLLPDASDGLVIAGSITTAGEARSLLR